MTDRAQLAFLGGDWPADLDPSLRYAALGPQFTALAAGDYIAPVGDDPTHPGRTGRVQDAEDGVYCVSWFNADGDFYGHHVGRMWDVLEGCRRIPGPRPLAPRPPDPQPAPLPGVGDVWQEVIDGERLAVLRELYEARRALGLRRYGHLLQRDNGRDHALDGQEELLDGIAYFTAAGWYDVVAALRTALLCVVARRGAA